MAAKAANYGDDFMRMAEKQPAVADSSTRLEGPSAPARPSAPGHQSARLCAARSAERIQARGLRPVPEMLSHLRERLTAILCHVEVRFEQPPVEAGAAAAAAAAPHGRAPRGPGAKPGAEPAHGGRRWRRRGGCCRGRGALARTPRNAPCPCGSGKKYKHCHGRV